MNFTRLRFPDREAEPFCVWELVSARLLSVHGSPVWFEGAELEVSGGVRFLAPLQGAVVRAARSVGMESPITDTVLAILSARSESLAEAE